MTPQEDSLTTGSGPTGSPQLMRRMNRRQVLLALRDLGPLSRPALSKQTGLSKITVNAVVAELVDQGRIDETADVHTGGPGPRTRVVSFNPDYAYVAAVDIGASRARIALSDLSGRIVGQLSADLQHLTSARAIIDVIRELFRETVASGQVDPDRIRAMYVATPGIVEPSTQRVTLAPQLPDWDSLDLVHELGDLGDFTIQVENEVRLAVAGEQWRGAATGIDDVAYFHLGMGVGLGLVVGGRIVHGANGAAGEVGYLPLMPHPGSAHDSSGPFEQLVGGEAYRRAAHRAIDAGHGNDLLDLAGQDSAAIDARLLYSAAIDGHPGAEKIVTEILQVTARGVAAVCAILNPAIVIIGGGIAQAGPWMLTALEKEVRVFAPLAPRFSLAGLGDDAALVGAIRQALTACEHELLDADAL